MTYKIIKTENYDVEIGTADTIDGAIDVIKAHDAKCKYPLGNIEFEIDDKDDGLDAFGSTGSRIVLFRTEKAA